MAEDAARDHQEHPQPAEANLATGVAAMAGQGPPEGNERPVRVGDKALVMAPWQGLALASLTGLVVWGTLELIMPVFQLPVHLRDLSGNLPNATLLELREALAVTGVRNVAFSLGLLAFTLAAVLTVAELLFRRDVSRAVWGGVLAGLVAALIAVGAGAAGAALSGSSHLPVSRLAKATIVQGVMFSLMGLGIGLAIALPMFRPRLLVTCVAGCLLGGLLGGLLFPMTVGMLLPNVNTDLMMPDPGLGRLLWLGLAAGLIGVTVTGLGKEKAKKP